MVRHLTIMANVEAFVAAPSQEMLEKCTKDQLLKIAEYYSVTVGDKRVKEKVSFACSQGGS